MIECILSKLKQVDDPREVLERVAKKVWALRGVDLDTEFRIPTPEHPPTREKTGRKPGVKSKKAAAPAAPAARKAAARRA